MECMVRVSVKRYDSGNYFRIQILIVSLFVSDILVVELGVVVNGQWYKRNLHATQRFWFLVLEHNILS